MKASLIAAAAALAIAGCSNKNNEAPQESAPVPENTGAEAGDDAGAHAAPQRANPHAQGAASSAIRVDVEDGVADFGAFRAQIPEGWVYAEPESQMRLAEFALPAEGEGEPAELVVYYFGEGGAGGVKANIDRWVGQFETEEEPVIENEEMAGMPVTTVDVSGRYVAAVRPGASQTHDEPDYRMFAAIVETAQGPFYFRMLGGGDAVAAHLDDAGALLESMQPAGAAQ